MGSGQETTKCSRQDVDAVPVLALHGVHRIYHIMPACLQVGSSTITTWFIVQMRGNLVSRGVACVCGQWWPVKPGDKWTQDRCPWPSKLLPFHLVPSVMCKMRYFVAPLFYLLVIIYLICVYFYVCECFACVCVCVCTTSVQSPWRLVERIESPKAGVVDDC